MLDVELKVFFDRLPERLKEHGGRFVVVKGQDIVSFHDTLEDALAEGARLYGGESFLARRIEKAPEEVSIPALTFGLLRANSSHTVFSAAKER